MLLRTSFFCLALLLTTGSWASNVSLKLISQNGKNVSLLISWEHGFSAGKTTAPHDAIWLFAKESYGSLEFSNMPVHCTFTSSRLVSSNGFSDSLVPSGAGLFLRTIGERFFDRDSAIVELQLQNEAEADLSFFALEMVYVAAGGYFLGDRASNHTFSDSSRAGFPLYVDNEMPLTYNKVGYNQIYTKLKSDLIADSCLIPTTFPKGTKSFYMMKHELSQHAWAGFLSTLPQSALAQLYPGLKQGAYISANPLDRNGIYWLPTGGFTVDDRRNGQSEATDGLFRACNNLSFSDLLAYLDWAALRPLTELEFEKATRGPLPAIAKEFAWGNNTTACNTTFLLDDGTTSERGEGIDTSCSYANYAAPFGQVYINGPIRQGFAARNSTSRTQAAAGYYGAMELSGNVWEQTIAIHPSSCGFTSLPGDGMLDDRGQANEVGWQGLQPIARGGGCNSLIYPALSYPFRDLAISDRYYANTDLSLRRPTTGGRGAR
jgi:formylglycine-generating enzyme required for sulfatase activity